MCLATSEDDVTAKPLWFQGEWTDGAQDFWDDFISDGSLDIDSGKVQEGCAIAKYMISVIFIFPTALVPFVSKRF